jgi:hypothetical protein
MRLPSPWVLMSLGFVLMLVGFVLPALMVLRLIHSSFALNFFSYTASTAGLFLGIIGIALQVPRRRL